MKTLLISLKTSGEGVPLAAEAIVSLIEQHLKSPRSSRLPVLVVAAVYKAASDHLREQALPLRSHHAADEQIGAMGDIEVTLINDSNIATSYEMKTRRITRGD